MFPNTFEKILDLKKQFHEKLEEVLKEAILM
jgi:hypothetical protein